MSADPAVGPDNSLGVRLWEAAMERSLPARDPAPLLERLHADVVFRSPVVHKPYEGAAMTAAILTAVVQVFDDFTYTDVLDCGDRAGFVFRAQVGDRTVEGWDYLHFDDDGLITDFTVMLRPMSGVTTMATAMKAKLEELGFI